MRSVDDIELFYSLLPSKVGSPLSIPSLARDLQVAYNTIRSWLGALLVEAKQSRVRASDDLIRLQQRLNVPAVQLVNEGEEFRILKKDGQRLLIAPAWQ